MKQRIQKLLASAGVASRRSVEEMVLQRRITVNGRVVDSLPVMVDPETDKVEVDDEPVKLAQKGPSSRRIYLLMNKPKGVFTTNVAQGEQTRAIDLLPPRFPFRVFPVGQLEAEAKGLLLLTNDGDLTNRLTHPRFGVPKTYQVVADGYVTEKQVAELEKGFQTGRSRIRVLHRKADRSVLEISLREGRNHQIRRMLAQVGHKMKEMTRTKIGSLELKGLAVGQFRELTPRELRDLQGGARAHRVKKD